VSPLATISGTMLVPGVSLNGRLYTRDMIAKAVTRARERLAADESPLTMLTHHQALDDSTRIVGRLTDVTLDESTGAAKYRAEIADTANGQTIAALVKGGYLRNVSIRGYFLGEVKRVVADDGQMAETADDLEIDGLDYTKTPGVIGATVTAGTGTAESSDGRRRIYESVEAAVDNETAPLQLAPTFADLGYLPDKAKRYPLDTRENATRAWELLSETDGQYTPKQLKRIKQRVRAALTKFGVDVTTETATALTEKTTRLGEVTEFADDGAGFCIDAYNGPIAMTLRTTWPGIDSADLPGVAQAAMDAVIAALRALDPDMDADLDVGAGPDTATTEPVTTTETAPVTYTVPAVQPTTTVVVTQTPRTETAGAAPTQKEAVVTDATTAVETAAAPAPAGAISFTQDQFAQLLAAVRPLAVETVAPAPAVAEAAAPAVEETEQDRINRLVAEGIAAALPTAIQAHAQANPPARKGLVATTTETETGGANDYGYPEGWPNKPLHKFTAQEKAKFVDASLVGGVLKTRA
jgi:hypothetical protein